MYRIWLHWFGSFFRNQIVSMHSINVFRKIWKIWPAHPANRGGIYLPNSRHHTTPAMGSKILGRDQKWPVIIFKCLMGNSIQRTRRAVIRRRLRAQWLTANGLVKKKKKPKQIALVDVSIYRQGDTCCTTHRLDKRGIAKPYRWKIERNLKRIACNDRFVCYSESASRSCILLSHSVIRFVWRMLIYKIWQNTNYKSYIIFPDKSPFYVFNSHNIIL